MSAWIALLLLAAGCGGARSTYSAGPVAQFPARTEVDQIARRPVPAVAPPEEIGVDTWTLTGPFPAMGGQGPYVPASTWETLVAEIAGPRQVLPSEPLRCVAGEVARFVATHAATPEANLEQAILGRCRATTRAVGVGFWSARIDPRQTDDEHLTERRAEISQQLSDGLARSRFVGAATARIDDRVAFAVVFSNDAADVEPIPPAPDATNVVTIRGRSIGDEAYIYARVNRGPHGFASCDVDPAVRPPAFVARCMIAPEDTTAWIQVLGGERGRVLTNELVAFLVTREGADLTTWSRVRSAAPAATTEPRALAEELVARINRLRTTAGMRPLTTAASQSATNAALAPHAFAAAQAGDTRTEDAIALGVLAGWDVTGGTIRDADFYYNPLRGSTDLDAWLADATEMPSGRESILDPEMETLAVGVAPVGPGLAGIICSYAFFESADHTADATRVVRNLFRWRQAHRRPRPERVALRDMHELVAEVSRGRNPGEVLDELMRRASLTTIARDRVQGYIVEASNLDAIEWPESMLDVPRVAVSVGHRRVMGAPWGQYVIFVVLP